MNTVEAELFSKSIINVFGPLIWISVIEISPISSDLDHVSHEFKLSHLLRQQEVGEDLEAGDGVQVGVELHQGLGLVVGQPDGGDALQWDMVI